MRPDSSGKSCNKNLMHLFYTPVIDDTSHELNEEESRHCVKVLRLKKEDIVHLTDGKGNLYQCRITNSDPKKCKISIEEKVPSSAVKRWHLHIAMAPTKNIDRFEWFVEKATEIGIDEITPVFCERSERKFLKTLRLEKVIIAAMKQSLRIFKPMLNDPMAFSDLINRPSCNQKFIAYCETGDEQDLIRNYRSGSDVLILNGPEGDFSAAEIKKAKLNGFIPISLGSNRLRTETAGIVACQTINMINQMNVEP